MLIMACQEDEQEHGIKKQSTVHCRRETAENLLTKSYNVTDKNQLEADRKRFAYAIDSGFESSVKVMQRIKRSSCYPSKCDRGI